MEQTINLSHGFLPETDPLKCLPDAFYEWEHLGNLLPKLLVSDSLRREIKGMSVLDTVELQRQDQLERAMLLLSFLGHAYVWGSLPILDSIPKALAVPWYQVAKKLQRPPVLSYASYALHNWQRINKHNAIQLGNIALLQNFLGGLDEEWFVLVHVDIEYKAAPILNILSEWCKGSEMTPDFLALQLKTILTALKGMLETLEHMPEHCDPYIYYQRVRPYIHGWKDNPALPQGLRYEGVVEYQNQPQQFRGETGAQSTIIPCLDAAFGVHHEKDVLRVYLQEMRDYMPFLHKEFLGRVESNVNIRSYVLENHTKYPDLKNYYNECIKYISLFRQTHIQYAAHYIQKQSQTSEANPTEVGTGGTPFMNYLRKHKDETLKYII